MERHEIRARLRLYAITPGELSTGLLVARIAAAARAGVTAVQYRDKVERSAIERATRLAAVAAACRDAGVWFVVNDDPEIALEVGADAVHLGPADAPVDQVRARVGERLAIGASAGTVERAAELVRAGADYLGVGAIYDARPSKGNASAPRGPQVLRAMRAEPALASFPIVAIGGVTPDNAGACLDAGADGVAAIRGLLGAADAAEAAAAFAPAFDRR